MCGIAAILMLGENKANSANDICLNRVRTMLSKIQHRGDLEYQGECHGGDYYALGTNRLGIVDPLQGKQPLNGTQGRLHLVFNGEIYNFIELREQLIGLGHLFHTSTDTEVILNGYLAWGVEVFAVLDGMFSIILIDEDNHRFIAARDHVGIKPLYFIKTEAFIAFASEQKCLLDYGVQIEFVPPGCYMDDRHLVRYFSVADILPDDNLDDLESSIALKALLDRAVRTQVQTEQPIVVMFSGGIDSAIVLHLAAKYHRDVTALTFGFPGSADLLVAERFCKERGIRQIIRHFTQAELISNLAPSNYIGEFFEAIDSIDVCIASMGYEIAHRHGFKIALCGEGSDELLGGYDLFRTHVNPVALGQYRVQNLHRTDLQRVDRASMMHSVEARVPFLDKALVKYCVALPFTKKLRRGVEKWILREAFSGDLPPYILWRPKVRMPDGSGVKDMIMEYAKGASRSSDDSAKELFPTPQARYFLQQYLDAGFRQPNERHRREGWDYSAGGYFTFIT